MVAGSADVKHKKVHAERMYVFVSHFSSLRLALLRLQ